MSHSWEAIWLAIATLIAPGWLYPNQGGDGYSTLRYPILQGLHRQWVQPA